MDLQMILAGYGENSPQCSNNILISYCNKYNKNNKLDKKKNETTLKSAAQGPLHLLHKGD